MHRHEVMRTEVFESLNRLVRAHMDCAKRFRMVRADRQQGDLRRPTTANFLEAVKVRAVASVINAAALVFENKSSITAMMIAQRARAPMFAWRESHLPSLVGKTFPPL